MNASEKKSFMNLLDMYFESTANTADFKFYEENIFFGENENGGGHYLHIARFCPSSVMHVNHYYYLTADRGGDFLEYVEMFIYGVHHRNKLSSEYRSGKMRKQFMLFYLDGEVLEEMMRKLGYAVVKEI